MTLRSDSFGTVAEVVAFTRRLLVGQSTFNSTTVPTGTEVEKFIDRASAALNVALQKRGLSDASVRANSTAKLICDDWVVQRAAEYVEMTQESASFSGDQNQRPRAFTRLYKKADEFAEENRLGLIRLGVTVNHKLSEGLVFTGETAQVDRTDPDDTSLEQPFFTRRLFDDLTASDFDEDDE